MDPAIHRFGEDHRVGRDSVRQGLAWMVAAEVVRRHPGVCRVIETHPHNSDNVTVQIRPGPDEFAPPREWKTLVHLNKDHVGHLTPGSWVADPPPGPEQRMNWLDVLLADDLRSEVVEPIERGEGLPSPGHTPETTAQSIGVRLLAAFAQRAMFARRPWVLINGMASDDHGWSQRDNLFEQLPWAERQLDWCHITEPDENPAWRFWFLAEGANAHGATTDRVHLAVDTVAGVAFAAHSGVELLPEYRRLGSSIDRLASLMCPPVD